ncbi:hypothetical protein HaLaN_07906 [Haematococcus lacustris]|uniref:Uncharacterized protein n=1 Tax=Haematococcus lacustris TaxID=44745 RepID=A0A699YXL2_HAELA|nr:hypothetical protein HaLaN_07906 [Haematococcus lacustris]
MKRRAAIANMKASWWWSGVIVPSGGGGCLLAHACEELSLIATASAQSSIGLDRRWHAHPRACWLQQPDGGSRGGLPCSKRLAAR